VTYAYLFKLEYLFHKMTTDMVSLS